MYVLYAVYENILALTPEDVADAVEYAVSSYTYTIITIHMCDNLFIRCVMYR